MEQIYTFHKTAHGYGHIQKNQPCEDASGSFREEDGSFSVAVVADGHGQARSFRSRIGSQLAVDAALDCLKDAANAILSSPEESTSFYSAVLECGHERQIRFRQLTDTILSQWNDRIWAYHAENLPTQEELGEYAEFYEEENRIPQIYGTTLIAALWLPRCLVLIQQGDGRCCVFYADGTYDQPIPWDDRCEGNRTSSMCDADAADRVRFCVIDLEEKNVAACYLCTDGVEDAYRNQEGAYVFCKALSCDFQEKEELFDSYLGELLPEFSARGRFGQYGSLDDVSVAGIINTELLSGLGERYQKDIQCFQLGEEILAKEAALQSKKRKHGILQKRMEAAEAACRDYLERHPVPLESPEEPETAAWFGKKLLDGLFEVFSDPEPAGEETEKHRLEDEAAAAKKEFEDYDVQYQEIASQIRMLQEMLASIMQNDTE